MVTTHVRVLVDVIEGEFDTTCEVCFVQPTALLVRIAGADVETPQYGAGVDGAGWGSRAPETATERYFCAEHVGAANQLVDAYRD